MTANKQMLGLMMGVVISMSAGADEVILDDLIVQGSECVGFDCIANETFDGDILKLKENNLRIRFHDTSIGDVLGQSWDAQANASWNGEPSYFEFQVKSLEQDSVLLSEGGAPAYDCDDLAVTKYTIGLPPSIGTIPFGEPTIRPTPDFSSCEFISGTGFVCFHTCEIVEWWTEISLLKLGTASNDAFGNSIAIGYDSTVEDGVVTVGRADLLRRIAHVAAGISSTDAVTVEDLDNFSVFDLPSITLQQIVALNAQLDGLAVLVSIAEIDALIDQVEALGLPNGQETPLLANLDNAKDSLAAGDFKGAIDWIDAFNVQTESKAGSPYLSAAEADALVTRGEAIIEGIRAIVGTGPLQDLINVLITSVEAIGLPPGLENSFRNKLISANNSLVVGDSAGAIAALNAFIDHVSSLAGGVHLSAAQAADLIAQAQAIIDAITPG